MWLQWWLWPFRITSQKGHGRCGWGLGGAITLLYLGVTPLGVLVGCAVPVCVCVCAPASSHIVGPCGVCSTTMGRGFVLCKMTALLQSLVPSKALSGMKDHRPGVSGAPGCTEVAVRGRPHS